MSEWDGKTERRTDTTMATQQAILLKLDMLDEKMSSVCRFIEGNGKPERGAVVRLDRLEQVSERRQKHVTWLWAAVGGGAMKALYDLLKGK